MKARSIIAILLTLLFTFACSAQEKIESKADTSIVSEADAAKAALNVGATMPSFTLKDAKGESVASSDLLKKGNLVVVFYRGAWCPFCNLYLKKLQDRSADIAAAGGNLVAISVENPDRSAGVVKKDELTFTVLSDPNLDVARKFGIVYQLADATNEQYKSHGLDLAKYNETAKAELPLAVTYVVKKDGTISYAFIETDYKKRADPDEVIKNLEAIR